MASYEEDWQQAEQHQDMLNRQQMLIQALSRAVNGMATPDDWNMIRFECGLSNIPNSQFMDIRFNTNLGENYGISSKSK